MSNVDFVSIYLRKQHIKEKSFFVLNNLENFTPPRVKSVNYITCSGGFLKSDHYLCT